tara:strand:+ start:1425 stop:2270 length:846 start_codon:yes stop_codon:yes gene_type:complete
VVKFSSTGIGNFAAAFAQRSLASQRVGFELRFNQLQNTLIGRFNEQVEKADDTPLNTQRKINTLQKKAQDLVSALPLLQEYRQGNTNNQGQLEALFEEVSGLFSTFNQDATVDADEVAAFNAQRDVVINRLNNIFVFSHPDINDANTIQRLKDNLDTLRGLEVVAGPLSDSQNQAVSDTLTRFQTETSIGITVTQNTISTTLDLEQRIEAKFSSVDAELLELTTEEQARRSKEIENMQIDLGNQLRAISISFEMNAAFAESLQARLTKALPQPGSVLNLFS